MPQSLKFPNNIVGEQMGVYEGPGCQLILLFTTEDGKSQRLKSLVGNHQPGHGQVVPESKTPRSAPLCGICPPTEIQHFSPFLRGQLIHQWQCKRPKPVGRREAVGFQLRSEAMHCGFCNVLVVIQGRHLIARFLQFQESNWRAWR